MHYNMGSRLYFASLFYQLFKIRLTFFQISLTGNESKYMFKFKHESLFIVINFFKPFICPFLKTCAFQLYMLMPTPLLSELAHLSTGQLQSSWDPFGDHGMKLVAFKVIHAPALVKTFCTHLNHFQFQMFLLGSFSKAFLCKTLSKLDKGRRNDVADVDPPEVLHCFHPPQWCHNGLDSGCEYCCLTLF